MAVYDANFLRGQLEHLEVMRQAMTDAEPGLAALTAGLEASGTAFAAPVVALEDTGYLQRRPHWSTT